MSFEIIGEFSKNQLFCSGSFSKLTTSFVTLSFLAERFNLDDIIDDDNFLDAVSQNNSRDFLSLFQKIVRSKFSLHDLYSHYTGLPYTFDIAMDETEQVEAGATLKHHQILAESEFLNRCQNSVTALYLPKSKFHYSELSILFIGYWLEKNYNLSMEDLYHRYLLQPFKLKGSSFSRKRLANVYYDNLANKYDYPSVAYVDHGYFCYSNGFFTTLNDMKIFLENLMTSSIFRVMTDLSYARAASNTLMNGLSVEIRQINDDTIYGYEGLSYSGCNIWAYSTKLNQGFLAFTNDEDEAYSLIYNRFGYEQFDKVPPYTQSLYQDFRKKKLIPMVYKNIPLEFQGEYQRVKINDTTLQETFNVSSASITIRDPERMNYEIIFVDNVARVKGKDQVPNEKIGFIQSNSGNYYMYHDGALYRKISTIPA